MIEIFFFVFSFAFFLPVEFAAYELGNVLGAGGFGLVMSATRKDDNMPVGWEHDYL